MKVSPSFLMAKSFPQCLRGVRGLMLCLYVFSTGLYADDAQLPPEAQRAMKEYDSTVDVAKKRLVAQLQAVMQSETTRGRLDAALAVRAKIVELAPGVLPPAPAAPVAPVAVAPMGGGTAGAEGQVYEINAKDNKGTLVGPAKKGQRIHVQYVEGTWSVSEGKNHSPEDPGLPMHQVAVVGTTAAGDEEVVALVPAGTKRRAFSEGFKKDYTEVRLRSNDGTRNDNFGTVKYKASIR